MGRCMRPETGLWIKYVYEGNEEWREIESIDYTELERMIVVCAAIKITKKKRQSAARGTHQSHRAQRIWVHLGFRLD